MPGRHDLFGNRPVPEVPVALTVSDIHGILSEAFPAKAERASLEYVETVARPTGGFAVVVRLIVWDSSDGGETLSIRDVKEQEVWFDPNDSSVERLAAYATAFIHVASCALANIETVEVLMPHDLFISNVLELSRAETYLDFVKALSVKSRLGRYLPAES